MLQSAKMIELAARKLKNNSNSVYLKPVAKPANKEELAALAAVLKKQPRKCVIIEKFPRGEIVYIFNEKIAEKNIVALISDSKILAAVSTSKDDEADSIYAGLAEDLQILTGTCFCGNKIASIYEICATCA